MSAVATTFKWIGLFATGIGAGTAGVGGGAVLIPYLILVFHFLDTAIPLSKVSVLGAALVYIGMYLRRQRATERDGSAAESVAWDVILILEPATLAAAPLGARLAIMSPFWFVAACLVMLLLLSFVLTWRKAVQKMRKERVLLAEETLVDERTCDSNTNDDNDGDEDDEDDEDLFAYDDGQRESIAMVSRSASSASTTRRKAKTRAPPADRNDTDVSIQSLRRRCLLHVTFSWLLLLTTTLLSNSSSPGSPSLVGVPCGSTLSWLISFAPIVILCLLTIFNVRHLRSLASASPNSILARRWSVSSTRTILFTLFSFCAGFLSAFAGIGGSTIKTPLLLHIGLSPGTARVSSQLMLLTTCSLTMAAYAANGLLPPAFAAALFASGSASALIGAQLMQLIVRRTQRSSPILFALAIYILLACVCMTVLSSLRIVEDIRMQEWNATRFHGLCEPYVDDGDDYSWIG